MNETTGVINGLTAVGVEQLRMVVREEVAAGIKAALSDPVCPRPCERVRNLEETTYGDGDRAGGLKGRVTTLEEQVGNLVWLTRTALGAAIVAAVATIIQIAG